MTYGGGQRVGGETLRYDDTEIEDDALSEEAFEKLRERWPMGHLGRLLGLARGELLRLPYARSVLVPLESDAAPSARAALSRALGGPARLKLLTRVFGGLPT